MHGRRLGVGFIGSGFMTRFHIRSWEAVGRRHPRHLQPDPRQRRKPPPRPGRCTSAMRAFGSIESMVADESIDCIWLCGPNFARREHGAHRRGDQEGREAARHRLREAAGAQCRRGRADGGARRRSRRAARLPREPVVPAVSSAASRSSGCVAPPRRAGRTSRAAEEHGGPHMPWFWQGDLQGGGVLNDMMCHSLEVGRYLLTKPGAPQQHHAGQGLGADRLLEMVAPEYAKLLRGTMTDKVDYARNPAEDFARATVNYVDEAGTPLIVDDHVVELRRRRTAAVDGAWPEYSMSVSTSKAAPRCFLAPPAGAAGRRGSDREAECRAGPDADRRQRGAGTATKTRTAPSRAGSSTACSRS